MTGFDFTLKSNDTYPVPDGFTANAGPFGAVSVVRPRGEPGRAHLRQVLLSGPSFPDAEFNGGAGILPSVDGGRLTVDGTPVDMALKVQGIRKGSRRLELNFRGQHYTYTSNGFMKRAQLSRDDVTITLDTPPWKKGGGRPARHVSVEGEALVTDLTIALVLEEVNTNSLTTMGAILSIPGKVLFSGAQRDEGSPE